MPADMSYSVFFHPNQFDLCGKKCLHTSPKILEAYWRKNTVYCFMFCSVVLALYYMHI